MSAFLSPSLLSADFANLGAEVSQLENAGIKWLHLDVMDGCFVPNITFGAPVIASLRERCGLFFDAHLMIVEPDRHLEALARAGADLLVVHVETLNHAARTLEMIRNMGLKAGVSVNPGTDLCVLRWLLPYMDLLLIMGVNPGFSGQKFIPSTLDKTRAARDFLDANGGGHIVLEVDGGVSLDNAGMLVAAGADVLVSGSAFFRMKDYAAARDSFEKVMDVDLLGRQTSQLARQWRHM